MKITMNFSILTFLLEVNSIYKGIGIVICDSLLLTSLMCSTNISVEYDMQFISVNISTKKTWCNDMFAMGSEQAQPYLRLNHIYF